MLPRENQEHIWTISELNQKIDSFFRSEFSPIWVTGEISNFRRQPNGHCYFTLKDQQSQLSAVLFRGNAERIETPLNDGRQIFAFGELSVYAPRGTYQIIIRHILDKGFGELQIKFEQLKNRLTEEGLFAPERKKSIPMLPRRIGFITSSEGAALRDFISVLKRRGWRGEFILLPASVQGKQAVSELTAMLRIAPKLNLDLVVIGRGGGSLEDLWSFNEEALVRAVADCPVPTISAVGHQTDFTLCDFAADLRVETPTAAAEKITSAYLAEIERITQLRHNLIRWANEQFQAKRHDALLLISALKVHSPEKLLENAMLHLDEITQRLWHAGLQQINGKTAQLHRCNLALAQLSPEQTLERSRHKIEHLTFRFEQNIYSRMVSQLERLQQLERRLQAGNLNKTLARGFSYLRKTDGSIVSSVAQTAIGESLTAQLRDGSMDVKVISVQTNNP